MGDRPMAAHLEGIDKTKMTKVGLQIYIYNGKFCIVLKLVNLTKPPNFILPITRVCI